VNNCIGANNYRYFVSFLAMHVFFCGYAVFIVGYALLGIIIDKVSTQLIHSLPSPLNAPVMSTSRVLNSLLLCHPLASAAADGGALCGSRDQHDAARELLLYLPGPHSLRVAATTFFSHHSGSFDHALSISASTTRGSGA
jgi:hypothetical protein